MQGVAPRFGSGGGIILQRVLFLGLPGGHRGGAARVRRTVDTCLPRACWEMHERTMAAWRRMNEGSKSGHGRRAVLLAGVVLMVLSALPAMPAMAAVTAATVTPAPVTPATPAALAATAPAPGAAVPGGGDGSPGSVAEARRRVYPALVNISMVKRYFEHGQARRASAAGSGVIVSPDRSEEHTSELQ